MSLAFHHEGQGPSLMTLLVSAVASGVPASGVTPSEGPGQQIAWDGEKAEQLKLALPEVCSLRASWFSLHIVAILLQVKEQMQVISERENRTQFLHSLSLRHNRYLPGVDLMEVVPTIRDSCLEMWVL